MKIVRIIISLLTVSVIISLINATKVIAQEYTETKYNAQIIGAKYEKLETGNATTFEIQIQEGEKKNEIVEVTITEEDTALKVKNYKVGDRVIVIANDGAGETQYFISDHIRIDSIYILIGIFVLITILIGRKTGFQSLIGLTLSTLVLILFIIPRIEKGENLLFMTFIGSVFIAFISIYLSHGLKRKSTIALIGTLVSLVLTVVFGIIFTNILKLTGYSSEDALFLIGVEGFKINMKDLLISSLIFGGIGILDDVTVSQVSVVQEIYEANKNLTAKELYQKAMNVGRDHISSMVNTLFLAYASSSLPLIILLRVQSVSLFEIINNEPIAEEILRTVVGSIGLILAVPITTAIAVYFYKKRN